MKKKIALTPLLTILFFAALIIIYFTTTFYQGKKHTALVIAQDTQQLSAIFEKIDQKCSIIDFEYQKNHINFLNVKEFVGSEVGPMNLTYPKKWEGPYVDDNPTMQEKEYLLVRTKKGYFITPGIGVKLPNGKIIGTDIKLDEDADITELMRDKKGLRYKDSTLAAPVHIKAKL